MATSNKTLCFLMVVVFIAALLSIQSETAKAQSKTITVPEDYPTVSAAIANAANGDTILVRSGTYDEDAWKINKSVTITSDAPNGAKLIFHPPTYQHTIQLGRLNSSRITSTLFNDSIKINADDVRLSGFSITNAPLQSNDYETGYLSAYGNQILIANNIMGTDRMRFDLAMTGSRDQAINNTLMEIAVAGANQTTTDNKVSTIDASGSFDTISNNQGGTLTLTGSNNNVTGNSFSPGLVQLIGADHNTITNNSVTAHGNVAIAIGYANPEGGSYNVFAGNTIRGALLWGILLARGSHNVFYGNLIADNGLSSGHNGCGLALGGNHLEVDDNVFYGNIFENNGWNLRTNWEVLGMNAFDKGKVGNYCDDYLTKYPNATQVGSSGTGNIPYLVYGNVTDNHPLLYRPNVSTAIPYLPNAWLSLNSVAVIVTILFVIGLFSFLFYRRHRRISKQQTA